MGPESHRRSYFESFQTLNRVQEALARQGYFFFPVEKEHAEGLITDPLLQRLRTTVKKRGFPKVAGHVAITFTGFAEWLLTMVASCRQQERPLLAFLAAAGEAAVRGSPLPSLVSAPQGG